MAYTKTVTYAVAVAGTHTLTLSDVDNLYVGEIRPLKAQRALTRVWTKVKSGQ